MGPMQGIRALEIGDRGEVAGKLLADAGADVIRVEPTAGAASRRSGPFAGDQPGPERSLHFAYFNTSKRGLTLNFDDADGRALWRQLVARMDVVIDSSAPTHLDDLGAGYEG